jgi:hypothetical protein
LRRECRIVRLYLTILCALLPIQHTRLRVRLAPGIPCALCLSRDTDDAKPGRKSRRGAAKLRLGSANINRGEHFRNFRLAGLRD